MIFIVAVLFFLIITGVWLYLDFAGGIDSITAKIKRPWLKIILRILLKTVTIIFIVAGALATAFVALIFSYDPKKKK